MLCVFRSAAQFVQGVVSDATTGETLPTVHVYYVDDKSTVVQTDINGKYKIAFRKGKLIFSMMGFESQTVEVKASQRLNIKLRETASSLQEVTVTRKRTKYQRKNNPAVDMMRKVIEAKKATDLRQNDYLSYMKYEKMTFALNEFTEKVFQDIFPVKAVDTTAAGDTFAGYFLATLAAGETAQTALQRASKAAAIAVTRPGAAGSIPWRKELT